MLSKQNKELSTIWKPVSFICKSIDMGAFQAIILLAQFAVFKYNPIKILKFLSGDYCSASGGEFHI
jgi:hypothetical protein